MGVAVGVGMAGVAVGGEMDTAVEVGWEQAIATGRTKAMAIPTAKNALGRISDADLASAFPHLVGVSGRGRRGGVWGCRWRGSVRSRVFARVGPG